MSAATSTQLHSLEVEPLAGALGAEITGVDLARTSTTPPSPRSGAPGSSTSSSSSATRSSTPTQFLAFARRIGEPVEYPFVKGIDGHPGDHRGHQAAARDGELRRHLAQRHRVPRAAADGARCCSPARCRPSAATRCSPTCTRAYEALSPGDAAAARRAAGGEQLGAGRRVEDPRGPHPRQRAATTSSEYLAEHPVVRTHPETGRKALYVNRRAHRVVRRHDRGGEPAAARSTSSRTRSGPSSRAASSGRSGSLALWDNRCAMHNPINDYHGYTRRDAPHHARRRHTRADRAGAGHSTLVLTARSSPGAAECRPCHPRGRRAVPPQRRTATTSRRTSRTARTRAGELAAESRRRAALLGRAPRSRRRRRTSACCSTTPPSTCSGSAPPRSPAR